MKYLEPNELKKLLDTTRSADDHKALRDRTILTVAYRHAMRAEEISNLTFKDVDLKSNTIRIRRVKGSLESIQPIEAAPGPRTTSGQDTLAITFAVKVPQVITHEKVLVDCEPEFDEFIERMQLLSQKLGPVLLQFPEFDK